MARAKQTFDPRALLAALERNYVDYVVIGGLAGVIRGTSETTAGVDVCPSFAAANLTRLVQAAAELNARPVHGTELDVSEEALGSVEVTALSTSAGELNVVPAPAGAPTGFVDLRRTATKEHLGHGLRPLVASTADLARLAAALHRDQDVARISELRRIMELEVDRGVGRGQTTPRRRRGEEAQTIADLHWGRILDLSVGSAGQNLEQISLWPDRRRRNVAQLCAGQVLVVDQVMDAVDLDPELRRSLRDKAQAVLHLDDIVVRDLSFATVGGELEQVMTIGDRWLRELA